MAFFYRPTELRKISLEKFITEALPSTETIPVTDTEALRDAWKKQIQTVLQWLSLDNRCCRRVVITNQDHVCLVTIE